MLIGGLYLAAFELLFARFIFFQFVIGGTVLAVLGAHLIWADFIAPRLGIKTLEDESGSHGTAGYLPLA